MEKDYKYKIIEKALEESEHRWRLLVENLPVVLMSLDRTGKILNINQIKSGLNREQVIGKNFCDFIVPEHRIIAKKALKSVFKTGEAETFEIRGRGPGGAWQWYSSRLVPVEKNGKIFILNLISVNINELKQKTASLKESEEKLRNIFDAAGDGILVLDRSGRHISSNKKISEMTGYTADEIIGKTFLQLRTIDSKELPSVLKMFAKTVASGKHIWNKNIELNLIKKDGSRFPAEISSNIVKKEGKVVGIILVVRDISDRKKTEEEINKSEEKFRTFFNSASDYLIFIDKAGKIIDINDAAVKNYGGKKEELIGKHFSRVGLMSSIKDLVGMTKAFESFLSGRKFFLDIKVKNKFGEESYLECYASILRLKNEIQGLLVVARNITERRRAEEALYREKNKLQKYLDVAEIIIVILDQNLVVSLVNKKGSEILGYKTDEIIGRNWCDSFVPEEHKDKAQSDFKKIISSKKTDVKHFESPILTKKGEERIIVWRRVLLEDETGKIKNVLSTGVDITELKAAMMTIEQLKEFDKLKDEFLNITAHELRSPLTSIVGLSELINQRKEYLSPDHQKYINIIYQEGIKLTHIVKRILTITRYESGRETFNFESINFSDFILKLRPSLDILAQAKKSKISIDIKDKNIFLESDKEKISQVVYNLVENAVKYGPEGQTITILVTKPDKKLIKLAVSDQGMGIPKDLQSKLFTKFSQLESVFSRPEDGTGLGLYICKIIIDKLGGKIGVKSVAGEGSVFYFILPLKQKDNINKNL